MLPLSPSESSVARLHWFPGLARDVIGAVRAMRGAPGITMVVVLTLALAIGANTAIFSIVHAVMLKRIPARAPEQLAVFTTPTAVSYVEYREVCARQRAFQGILARCSTSEDFSAEGVTGRLQGELVSGNYFRVLGVHASMGRLLQDDDERNQLEPYPIVISHRLWAESFHGDPRILQQTVHLQARLFQIVGVTEPGFSGSVMGQQSDFQIPLGAAQGMANLGDQTFWLQLMGRRRDDVSLAQAQAMMTALRSHLAEGSERQGASDHVCVLEEGSRGFSNLRDRLKSPTLLLAVAVGVLLLIACANVAGLLSARGIARQHEMAVRLSLGATRGRLIQQMLVESTVLALVAACCGLVFAHWSIGLARNLLHNVTFGTVLDARLDLSVLAMTAGLSVLACVLCGLLPALQASATQPILALRNRSDAPGSLRILPFRRLLVIGQVALSLALLSGAGVLARTLYNLRTVDLGFQLDRVLLLTLAPQSYGYSAQGSVRFFESLLEQARRDPKIESAAFSTVSVLSGNMIAWDVRVPGGPNTGQIQLHYISDGYFRTLGTSVQQGRECEDRDTQGSTPTAIVNQRFASFFWPGQRAIGKLIQAQGNREIVGVVKDSHYRAVREEAPMTVYLPASQASAAAGGFPEMTLLVRASGDMADTPRVLQAITQRLDPRIPAYDIRPLETQRNYRIASERMLAVFALLFAVLATIIAVVGLGGLLAFGVATRTGEIGIRMVCGARPLTVAWHFLREALILITLGLGFGVPLSWAALTLLSSVAFNMSPWDPGVHIAAIVLFIAAGFGAVLLPVYRAAHIDPASVLRRS